MGEYLDRVAVAAMKSLIAMPETKDWTRAQIAQEAYTIAEVMREEANRRYLEKVKDLKKSAAEK